MTSAICLVFFGFIKMLTKLSDAFVYIQLRRLKRANTKHATTCAINERATTAVLYDDDYHESASSSSLLLPFVDSEKKRGESQLTMSK